MFCSKEDYMIVQDISSQIKNRAQNIRDKNPLEDATALTISDHQSDDFGDIMEELEQGFICGENGITPAAVAFIMDYYNNVRWNDIKEFNVDRYEVPSTQELYDEVIMYNDEIIGQIVDQAELPARCAKCDQKNWCFINGDYLKPYEDRERQDQREECFGDAIADMYEYYTYNEYLGSVMSTVMEIVSGLKYAIWTQGNDECDLFRNNISCYMKDKMITLNDAQQTMFAEFADVSPFEPEFKLSEMGFMMIGCG